MFTNCETVTLLDILLNQNVLFYFMEVWMTLILSHSNYNTW